MPASAGVSSPAPMSSRASSSSSRPARADAHRLSGPPSTGTAIGLRPTGEDGMDAPLDRTKAEQFLGQVVSDVGTALLGALSFIGDRLDLFRTLADAGPVTIEALATRTGFSARYLREWLNAMTAAGYVLYRPESGHYVLPPEHATVLADPDSPFFVGGFLEMVVPSVSQATKLLSAFRSGGGVPQREYPPGMFEAIERGTAPWYKHHLLQDWIPTMPQVGSALARGGRAADVGCGSGQAALALARQVHLLGQHPLLHDDLARRGRGRHRGRDGRAEGAGTRRPGRVQSLPEAPHRRSVLGPLRAPAVASMAFDAPADVAAIQEAWVRRGRFVSLPEGHRLFVLQEGRGPDLLLVHGFPSSSHDFAAALPFLTPRFRVTVFDQL